MPGITLDPVDAAELAEVLTFLTQWLSGIVRRADTMINTTGLTHPALDKITRITMLLCLSRSSFLHSENRQDPGFADCGHDRDGPLAVEGRLLSGQCDTRSHAVSGCVDWRTS
jgi:hypothetical protein